MPREVVFDPYGEKSRGLGVSGEAIHPSEVLQRHGTGGNAEVLIQAVREFNPRPIKAASAKKLDVDRTKAARRALAGEDVKGIDFDVREIAGEGANVVDVAVRGGGSVVYVATDSQGTLYKGTFEISDPEGTHISQAEALLREGTVASQAIGPALAARRNASDELSQRTADLDAREKALAKRERELDQASGGDGGGSQDRPAGLPENYDELSASDAAQVVAGLEGPDRDAAIAYERANKGRKTVTGDE